MPLRLVDLEKLSHSHEAITSGYRASLPMQERGWTRYPCPGWDKPAIVAFHGQRCVGGLNFTEDMDDLILRMDFAWCEPEHPTALAMMLGRFRKRYAGTQFNEVRFTCHDGNDAMAKAVKVFGLTPFTRTYRMPLTAPTE